VRKENLSQEWRLNHCLDMPTYGETDDPDFFDPLVELNMTELRLYKVEIDGKRRMNMLTFVEHALFLGWLNVPSS
jgi:hypothetical protein